MYSISSLDNTDGPLGQSRCSDRVSVAVRRPRAPATAASPARPARRDRGQGRPRRPPRTWPSSRAASATQPATTGPSTAPRSPDIWNTATTVPPRPPTTSPITAPGRHRVGRAGHAEQHHRDQQAARSGRAGSSAKPTAPTSQTGDDHRPAAAGVGDAPERQQQQPADDAHDQERHVDPGGAEAQPVARRTAARCAVRVPTIAKSPANEAASAAEVGPVAQRRPQRQRIGAHLIACGQLAVAQRGRARGRRPPPGCRRRGRTGARSENAATVPERPARRSGR